MTASVGQSQDDVELVDELIAERREIDVLPADMPKWMAFLVYRIDHFSHWVGVIVCWLVVPIFLSMVYEIIVRKFFTSPTLWAYDISRMLYGAFFMLGSGYALMRGVHIRADFIYRHLPIRVQGAIDSSLYLILFLPTMIVFLYISVDYAMESWQRAERLDDTAWRPLVAPIRTVIPVSVFFLTLQGISEFFKSLYALRFGKSV